jgi:hypothetical protein
MLIYGQPMIPIYNFQNPTTIRLGTLSLIFFVFLLLSSCRQNKQEEIDIIWNNERAVAISIPKSLLNQAPADSFSTFLQVRLESENPVAILGGHSIAGDKLLFKPLIPFSRGLSYEIIFRNKQIGKIKIPLADAKDAPSLIAIYPTQDTLPENLLKLYLQFSRPMREGESQKYIALLNNHNDTLPNIFLDLQPELWNNERTVLTIWLDPGRIKRDLIPNQKMGNPLKKGERYTLTVSANWKDVQGLPLARAFTRQFIVGSRDSISPDPDRWTLDLPSAGTNQPLVININEPLDYFLLKETIDIIDGNGNKVTGDLKIGNEETMFEFIPDKQWLPGQYRLQIASYLEDLAGNNLDRVFDRDITVKQSKPGKSNHERTFVINH